jgi:phage baseplate assembly protein V
MAFSPEQMQQINEMVMNRVNNMFARGKIEKVTNGKTAKAKITMLSDEVYDGIEMPQQFGRQANPPVGSEVLVFFHGGNRDHGSIIATFNKEHSVIDLEEGESVQFDVSGSKILCKADGSVHITPSGGTVHITGSLVVSEDVSDRDGSMKEMRDDYNPHTHGGGTTPTPQMT